MAKPAKRRVQGGGRTTPKGGAVRDSKTPMARESSGRYTPPIPHSVKVSPWWVPAIMFALLGVGTLLILLNYSSAFWETNNMYLMIGLGLILGGIVTATQYH
jgi:hypothetical protein